MVKMDKDFALYIGETCRKQSLFHDLKPLGVELHNVFSAAEAKKQMQRCSYGLFLIQFEIIGKEIFELYFFIRSEIPGAIIMVLIAEPQNNIEKMLFDYGVDDIVTANPICTSTLASRIKRRLHGSRPICTQTEKLKLKGGAMINFKRREVRLNGYSCMLTGLAEKLLKYFLNNPDRVITRDEMLKSDIWDMSVACPGKEEQGKAFDMAILRLRRLIEADPQDPQIIKTVYGKGWMLAGDAVS